MPSGTSYARLVIAIDGPSGSGKSSVSRGAAMRLGLRYLDTGAQYRAMTYWLLGHGVDVADRDAVSAYADKPEIVSGTDPRDPTIRVDGEEVSSYIRGPEVTAAVSAVAAVPDIRRRLVALQQRVIGDGGVVVEGRDIGSVVAPNAHVKVHLTASAEVRAARRHAENLATADVGATQADLARRDAADSRTTKPMVAVDGAVLVDATHLTLEQVIGRIVELATVGA